MFWLEVVVFAIATWLGAYLIGRDPQALLLRYSGWGLLAYAATLASGMLYTAASGATAHTLLRLQYALVILPALCWIAALLQLLPEWRQRLGHWLWAGALGGSIALVGWAELDATEPSLRLGFILYAGMWSGVLALLMWLVLQVHQTHAKPLAVVAALFFALGAGLLLFPLGWLPRQWVVLAISIDLMVFGGVIAAFDAFEQGERLRWDMTRSLVASLLLALILGGQIALVMVLDTGATLAMRGLLLTVLASVILGQTQADHLNRFIDRLAFTHYSSLQAERHELRTQATTLARVDPDPISEMTTEDFLRLTRRALSNYGNLPRLATNPLTRLPLIDQRLQRRQIGTSTLERAAELKALLTESIERLKPRHEQPYGISEEWRHYNVLYYPYVLGLKPYSLRVRGSDLLEGTRAVLVWLQTEVPERTFYNWQNAAAQLIAQDLQEQNWQ